MGTTEAAKLLGVSRSTVLRSLRNEDRRAKWWGGRGEGWRYAPLSDPNRPIFQVRRTRAIELAGGDPVAE
jgi:hypothetical protein